MIYDAGLTKDQLYSLSMALAHIAHGPDDEAVSLSFGNTSDSIEFYRIGDDTSVTDGGLNRPIAGDDDARN